MVVSDFTVPELNYLRDNCNFVGNEIKVFEMRSKGIPLEEIADMINMTADSIRKVSVRVNKKIERVL